MQAAFSEWSERLRTGFRLLDWRSLALAAGRCPLCGPSVFVRLSADPLGARCLRCAGWPVSMAMAVVVSELCGDLSSARVYEASARGPWVGFLASRARELVRSELFDDGRPGEVRAGVVHQDLERLDFPDARFDLCTQTEVLEHVADDRAALRELRRVLAPGGWLVFTVPLFDRPATVERAVRLEGGGIEHRLPAEFHDDRLRGVGRVLVYREYGADIVQRVAAAGFERVEIREVADPTGFGHRPRVVVARRPADGDA